MLDISEFPTQRTFISANFRKKIQDSVCMLECTSYFIANQPLYGSGGVSQESAKPQATTEQLDHPLEDY